MMLSEFNREMAMLMPSWIWDWLQITLGLAVFIGSMIQRACSERFLTSGIKCKADAITTRAAQIALAIIGAMSFLVAIDGMIPPPSPPRSLVVIFLASYFAIQLRIIYQMSDKIIHKLNDFWQSR